MSVMNPWFLPDKAGMSSD